MKIESIPLSFIHRLVDLFYPLAEVTVFDAEGKIQEIRNSFSGLKEDQEVDVKNSCLETPYSELLAVGKNVRCLLYPLDKGKERMGYLRLRYDLTSFKNLQEQLQFFLQASMDPPKQKELLPWKESIDQVIGQFLNEKKINREALTSKQKRELLSLLQNQGLLDFKESSAYVASKLHISRATVYNYLKTTSDFRKVHVHQVDAFTNKRFGGNPAGVVLDAESLDEGMMRKIARELNLSETAFVSSGKKEAFKIRYFTPTGHEIAFCGHSTVGALYMIAREKRFGIEKPGKHLFQVKTPCGVLKMEVNLDEEGEIGVAYEVPLIQLQTSSISHEELAAAISCHSLFLDPSFPIMYEKTNKDLFAVVRSLEDLKKIVCDPKSLAQFSKQHDIVALCLISPKAIHQKNQFHTRCFAPLVGIPEDPFTGSVLGGLTAYVDTFGLLPQGISQFRVEQGHFMERPGVVTVEFSKKKGHYQAKVFAQAVHCFSTEITLT